MTLTVEQVKAELNKIQDPCSLSQAFGIGMVDMGLVVDVNVTPAVDEQHDVDIQLRVTFPGCTFVPFFEQAVHRLLEPRSDVRAISVGWGAHGTWSPDQMSEEVKVKLDARRRDIARTVPGASGSPRPSNAVEVNIDSARLEPEA
ncbi:metal-sulfur cluster assembly factor [Nocardioides sp.]|uniref:metal-sulfur cluster assembly factor n=1 Tax=Nocardioides sp. TaxID=35761 RepID=UPI003D09C8E7